jgi:hypothetical protein
MRIEMDTSKIGGFYTYEEPHTNDQGHSLGRSFLDMFLKISGRYAWEGA